MKRRSFVKVSALAGAAATVFKPDSNAMAANAVTTSTEFYELRFYLLKNEEQQKLVESFFREAAIPALNKLGIKNIGVFTELKPEGQSRIFALIPYKSLEQFTAVAEKLEADGNYQKQGAAYLNAPASNPAYERIESSFLRAFPHAPTIQVPEAKSRIFELRQYQSATESAGKKKIDMFNDKGEADIFKRVGFRPVFFAETIIGPQRPNLTYMVTFDDMAAHDRLWKAFGGDAEWNRIKVLPGYADALLVSKITSTFIVPTSYSQI